jgi:hypothetical protein
MDKLRRLKDVAKSDGMLCRRINRGWDGQNREKVHKSAEIPGIRENSASKGRQTNRGRINPL